MKDLLNITLTADDGEVLHAYQSGTGTPMLLLHGWTASHLWWRPLIDRLATHYRLLCPDARGHGTRVKPLRTEPDVRRLARDVINLLDHCGIERIAAVGHSMGALTLWQCIRDFGTNRFSHLCFIDQSPKLLTDATWQGGIYGDFDAGQAQRLLEALRADFAEAVLRLGALGLNDQARQSYLRDSRGWSMLRESMRAVDPTALIPIWESLVAADYRDVLAAIDRPTLLVYGTASNFYTAATARYVAAQIPHARLSVYTDADHSPHLASPQRFAGELTELLRVNQTTPTAHRDP